MTNRIWNFWVWRSLVNSLHFKFARLPNLNSRVQWSSFHFRRSRKFFLIFWLRKHRLYLECLITSLFFRKDFFKSKLNLRNARRRWWWMRKFDCRIEKVRTNNKCVTWKKWVSWKLTSVMRWRNFANKKWVRTAYLNIGSS